ncbi:hypothetical protein QQ045_010562 [Rhodiola kirilowii]
MPQTYVVHLGNSKDLMEVAESGVARRVLREHVRDLLGVRQEDLLFGIIDSVSRGKCQDLFLRSFHQCLQLIQRKKLQLPSIHAVIVGSDMAGQPKFESELRNFTKSKQIQSRVHFLNKTLAVAPYLAAIDVLVQNSQGRGECFGRITIEAMVFHLPVLATAVCCWRNHRNCGQWIDMAVASSWEKWGTTLFFSFSCMVFYFMGHKSGVSVIAENSLLYCNLDCSSALSFTEGIWQVAKRCRAMRRELGNRKTHKDSTWFSKIMLVTS